MITNTDIKHYGELGSPQPKATADRYNNGKPRMGLLDMEALTGLAEVLTFGANKYAANNWRKGLPTTNILDSMLRHIAAIQRGEDVDPESGLAHIDHVGCNWMFLSNYFKHPELYKGLDDRWKPE